MLRRVRQNHDEEPGPSSDRYLVGRSIICAGESWPDRYPELRQDYFGNYTRVVYLIQRDDPARLARARWAADQLGLPLEVRHVGLGALETRLVELMNRG
jgi:hypothetical protein